MTHSFYLYRAAGSASEEALDRLPTSATCMNLLKLPPYRRFVQFLYLIRYYKVCFVCKFKWECLPGSYDICLWTLLLIFRKVLI